MNEPSKSHCWHSVARILLLVFCGTNLIVVFCGTISFDAGLPLSRPQNGDLSAASDVLVGSIN